MDFKFNFYFLSAFILVNWVGSAQFNQSIFQDLHYGNTQQLKEYKLAKNFDNDTSVGLLDDIINYIDYGKKTIQLTFNQ